MDGHDGWRRGVRGRDRRGCASQRANGPQSDLEETQGDGAMLADGQGLGRHEDPGRGRIGCGNGGEGTGRARGPTL